MNASSFEVEGQTLCRRKTERDGTLVEFFICMQGQPGLEQKEAWAESWETGQWLWIFHFCDVEAVLL